MLFKWTAYLYSERFRPIKTNFLYVADIWIADMQIPKSCKFVSIRYGSLNLNFIISIKCIIFLSFKKYIFEKIYILDNLIYFNCYFYYGFLFLCLYKGKTLIVSLMLIISWSKIIISFSNDHFCFFVSSTDVFKHQIVIFLQI